MFIKSRVCRGLVAAFGGTAVLLPMASFAQEQTQNLQRVEITGSNIRRTDSETPSPVQVLSAEEIKRSGYTSVTEVLQSITANGQGTLSQSFSGAFATGAAGIALRGLNVGATLVLIDGHRMAPYPIGDDGQRQFVDTSNIPFDAVERIEVLKDGSSAVYGSDAIAGVVNIILKKSYKGGQLTADFGESGKKDGDRTHVAGIFGGGDLDTDGHTFFFSFEARRQNQIKESDRGSHYSNSNFTANGGYDLTPGALTAIAPFSSNRLSPSGYVTSGGQIVGTYPGCTAAQVQASQCTYPNTWSQIQPTTQNNNLLAKFTQRIGQDWQLALQASYFQSKSESVGNPSRTVRTAGFTGITSGVGVTPTAQPLIPGTSVPNGYQGLFGLPNNPTNPNYLHYTFNNLGPSITTTDARSSRLIADLDGTVAGWDVNFSAGFTQVLLNLVGLNDVSPLRLQSAINSGQSVIGSAITPATAAFIAPQLQSHDTSRLSFAHVGGSRDLMKLSGGNMAVAVGADYQYRTQNAQAPLAVQQGLYGTNSSSAFSNNFTVGKQNIAAVYAELYAPIMKQLEVDAAVRYDHYNISGGHVSPKVGIKYTPVPQFAIRGTASGGFRAPSPAENGQAGQTFFAGTASDPILCNTNGSSSANTAGNFVTTCNQALASVQTTNKALKPETSKAFTLGIIIEPIKDLSATLDLYQIQIDNQIVTTTGDNFVRSGSFVPIEQRQADGSTALVVPPVSPILYKTTTYVNANQTKTSGFDLGFQYRQHLGNIGDWTSNFMLSHQIKYNITVDGVTYKLAGTHGPMLYSGATGNPRNKIQWGNTFARDNWSVTGMINYISSFAVTDPSSAALQGADSAMGTCIDALNNGGGTASNAYGDVLNSGQIPRGLGCKVASFTTFDLSGKYNVSKQLTLRASILNLFNKDAPYDYVTYGRAGNAPYNPSLHLSGAIGRYFQVGATYSF